MKQLKLWRKLFPTKVCFLMWSVKWSCKQTNKKTFFGKISFVGIFCVYNRGHLFYFCLYKLTSYFLILKKFLLGCFLFWAPTCFLVLLCYFLLSFPERWPNPQLIFKLLLFGLCPWITNVCAAMFSTTTFICTYVIMECK